MGRLIWIGWRVILNNTTIYDFGLLPWSLELVQRTECRAVFWSQNCDFLVLLLAVAIANVTSTCLKSAVGDRKLVWGTSPHRGAWSRNFPPMMEFYCTSRFLFVTSRAISEEGSVEFGCRGNGPHFLSFWGLWAIFTQQKLMPRVSMTGPRFCRPTFPLDVRWGRSGQFFLPRSNFPLPPPLIIWRCSTPLWLFRRSSLTFRCTCR